VPGEGRFSSYTASSSTFGAGMFFFGSKQSSQGKIPIAKRFEKNHNSPSLLLPDSYTSHFTHNQARPQDPWGLQVTHTLHVDAMAYVENGWQTSNVQDDQDCTVDSSVGIHVH